MNLADVPRTLLRRWYLTLAGLVLTLGLSFGVLSLVPPTYEDKATILLLPPASSVPNGANPYLSLNELGRMADILSRAVNSQSTQAAVAAEWPHAKFTVAPDASTTGPILLITVQNDTQAGAHDATQKLVDLVPSNLAALQSSLNIRERSRITSSVLTQYDKPDVVRSGQLRAVVATVGVGLAGTTLLVALLDGALATRRRRRYLVNQGMVQKPQITSPTPASDLSDDWWESEVAASRSSD